MRANTSFKLLGFEDKIYLFGRENGSASLGYMRIYNFGKLIHEFAQINSETNDWEIGKTIQNWDDILTIENYQDKLSIVFKNKILQSKKGTFIPNLITKFT